MYPETPIDYATSRILSGVKNLREGLDPDVLAYWYKRVEDKSKEMVPPHLKDKVHFEQDRTLWLKFKMDVSKRAVPYVMQAIDQYIPDMPYSTGLYSSPSRRRRDGILGSGFFRRFVVEIDSQSQQLRLHEPNVFTYAGPGEILPLRFSGDTPVVEASVRLPDQSETKARFEIDTGCDGSICIGRHFVEANRLEPTNNLSGGRGNRYGVGGATRTHDSHLPQLRLGNLVVDRPEASLFLEGSPVEPPLAGHLGWNLLRGFKVIFDYSHARMILEKAPGKNSGGGPGRVSEIGGAGAP